MFLLDQSGRSQRGKQVHAKELPYFSIDNAHPNIFITPLDVHQPAVEIGSIHNGQRNSLKACALQVVTVIILSPMRNSLDLNSLMFN
jgi:hypothetical protein